MYLRHFKQVAAFFVGLVLCGAALPAAAQSALIIGAPFVPAWSSEVQAKILATGQFTTVDVVDGGTTTPTLATMQTYDAILVYSDANFNDPVTLGNNLHAYLLSGGGVVDAIFNQQGTNPTGAWQTNADFAQIPAGGGGPQATLGTVALPAHPIMAGVTSFNGGTSSYRGNGGLSAGATEVARWSTGELLVSYKPVAPGMVVSLNFFPPSSDSRADFWTASTDGDLLLANALTFAAAGGAPPATIPTMSEWAMILFGLMLAGGAAVMIQRRRLTA